MIRVGTQAQNVKGFCRKLQLVTEARARCVERRAFSVSARNEVAYADRGG